MPYIIIFFLILALFALPFLRKVPGGKDSLPQKPKRKLDTWGAITNIILGFFYVPISIAGCLMGMVGEGYMDAPTALQSFLCDTIMLLGVFTPLVSFCGVAASVLLRRKGQSALSFCIQFSGLVYFALIMGLVIILDYT